MSAEVITLANPAARKPDGGADRYVAFAFAAADLLVETDLDGVIGFATGAFRSRLGVESGSFVGRQVGSLFRPSDRNALEVALSLVPHHGRIAPIVLALADADHTEVAVSAFVRHIAGAPSRLSFSIGPMPMAAAALSPGPAVAGGLHGRRDFARLAEMALGDKSDGQMSLIEVKGWARVRESLSREDRQALEASIGTVLEAEGQGQTAGSLADGRYGLISSTAIDVASVVARLEAALQASPAFGQTRVEGAQLALQGGSIPQGQAIRALRYALGRFADGNAGAAETAGNGAGLAGILASAERHTTAMHSTLTDRRFRLLYQPVVSLADRVIHHYEALLRPIATPNLPMKDTQEFVTFAEAVGLSHELDWAVLAMAIEALQASPGSSVAVNMSGLSMQSPDYRDRLLARIAALRTEAGELAPNRLLVELTETAEIQDLETAASCMEKLRALGVPVCLDDFGAGASAFRYLRAFGVDYVKIDGAYVRAAGDSRRDRQLVASMVDLATSSGARVVAEMIETEQQARLMQELGVQFGQGWLFGKPGRLPGSG